MRTALLAATLTVIAALPGAHAQTAPKLLSRSAEIQAMADANQRGLIAGNGGYNAMLEVRSAGGPFNSAVHTKAGEFLYIIEGTVDIETGGTLLNPHPAANGAPGTLDGSAIQGGNTVRLNKGDFYIVPANTPHKLTPVGGKVVDMSMKLPDR